MTSILTLALRAIRLNYNDCHVNKTSLKMAYNSKGVKYSKAKNVYSRSDCVAYGIITGVIKTYKVLMNISIQ